MYARMRAKGSLYHFFILLAFISTKVYIRKQMIKKLKPEHDLFMTIFKYGYKYPASVSYVEGEFIINEIILLVGASRNCKESMPK